MEPCAVVSKKNHFSIPAGKIILINTGLRSTIDTTQLSYLRNTHKQLKAWPYIQATHLKSERSQNNYDDTATGSKKATTTCTLTMNGRMNELNYAQSICDEKSIFA